MLDLDLKDYDLIVVNSSGGKDSQAMLHIIATAARDAGVLDRVIVAHAALREEWPGTIEIVKAQAAAYGVPVEIVRRRQGDLLEHVRDRGKWPDSQARYCTSDHKRAQVDRVIRARAKHGRVLNCLGIRAQESTARAKKPAIERNTRLSTRTREVTNWFPIFRMTEAEVWATIREAGTPSHRAYSLGMPRLSCMFCVFAPPAALMLAGRENPELLSEYVATERLIGHRFRMNLAIEDIAKAIAAGAKPAEEVSTWTM